MQASIDRFWDKVVESGDCYIFTGCLDGSGYGNVQYKRKLYKAHRLAYMTTIGEIPGGLQLDHLCRVRNCINPNHLEPVTQAENLKRGFYWQSLKTHCKRGHEFTKDNTYICKRGWRICRVCSRMHNRKAWRKKNKNT